MLFKIPADEQQSLTSRVEATHGPGWRYIHTCQGIGPYNTVDRVDVFSNDAEALDDRRTISVLNGKILQPW